MARKPKATAPVEPLASPLDHPEAPGFNPDAQAIGAEVAESKAIARGDAFEPAAAGGSRSTSSSPRHAEPSYTGIRDPLPDGTVAHYRDYGNRYGVIVRLDLPDGVDRPAEGVTEPLKEPRAGHPNFHYMGKGDWHKPVAGPGLNPVAERLDAEDRFAEAVKRQRAATGKERDGI